MAGSAPVTAVHGRSEESRALEGVLDRLASERPGIMLVEGEAGIGKTRLLTETVQRARDRGFQVVLGRGEEVERTRPFGIMAEALDCVRSSPDPRRSAIAALLTTHEGDVGPITVTSDAGLQFRVVDAFVDLVEELALHGPLMIGLDDLQWADPSSLLVLSAIGRRLAYLPVVLVGAYRPSPRSPQLQRVVASLQDTPAWAGHLGLGRLSEQAVSDLVAEALDAEPGPGLLREIAGAGGNPLFVTELLGAICEEGMLRTADGRAEVDLPALPPTLRLTILRRLSFLPDEALQALRSASILGSSFTLTDLSVTTEQPAMLLAEVMGEAIAARVLADDGARLRFRHDLIRDAIYEDLPGSVRLALHKEAGQRLAAAGAPALLVAEHLDRGSPDGDTETVAWMTAAAREASGRSPDIAAELLGRVIEHLDPGDPGRDRLLAELASSLMSAGRVAEAQSTCRNLLDRPHDPTQDGPVRSCLGLALLAGGRPIDGLAELELATRSPLLVGAERARALGWASIARMWLGDLDGASVAAEEARAAGVASGDDMTATIGTAMFAVIALLRGRLGDADRLSQDAMRLADRSPGLQGHRYPVTAPRAFILVELDRLEDARAVLDAGARVSEKLGTQWHLPSYQMVRAMERFAVGEWDDAVGEVEASLGHAGETGESYNLIVGQSVLSLIRLHRNDIEGAAAAADAAAGQLVQTGARYRAQWALFAQALAVEARGGLADAYAMLCDCWDLCVRLELALEFRAFGPDLVRLAVEMGDAGRAHAVVASVAELAAGNDIRAMTATALRCQGLLADDPEILRAAVDAHAGTPRPLDLALVAEEAGAAFARRGRLREAQPLLTTALEGYERLSATRDLARTQATLRDTGIRRGRRGSRARPTHGWASLTDAERTVALLVAEGLSNPTIGDRLYVSRRTVQSHLAHVFAKLDISSRAQLAAEVTRRSATAATGPGPRTASSPNRTEEPR